MPFLWPPHGTSRGLSRKGSAPNHPVWGWEGAAGSSSPVIGDPVNVAARVETLTRETGDVVMLTEATRCHLSNDGYELIPRGYFALKGVSEPVPIYALELTLDKSSSGVPKAPQARA